MERFAKKDLQSNDNDVDDDSLIDKSQVKITEEKASNLFKIRFQEYLCFSWPRNILSKFRL